MFQGHRSTQSHELFAFVVTAIGDRVAQAFSESHRPCCERVRVCFCESQLDINHFTRRGASHAAHPRPSKTLERKRRIPPTPPVNGAAAALSFPLVRLLHWITCVGDGPSHPGSRCRNTTGARAGPTAGISHQRRLMFPLDAVDKVQRSYPR